MIIKYSNNSGFIRELNVVEENDYRYLGYISISTQTKNGIRTTYKVDKKGVISSDGKIIGYTEEHTA